MYEPRTYRRWIDGKDLVNFNVTVKQTDLYISATSNLTRKAHRLVLKYRHMLESYIEQHPIFLTTLEPMPIDDNAPLIVKEMMTAAQKAGVGPMAAVAGAIAEFVGKELLAFSPEIIIENGGDIFLKTLKKRIIGIYAGNSPLSEKIGLEIEPESTPLGVCTSSGTVGHSLSFGQADAATAIAQSATLADAAATAVGNRVRQATDIPQAIEFARSIPGITGVLIVKDDQMGVWGEMRVCETGR